MKTDTPTLRERFRATFRATLKTSTGVSEFLADSNTSYIYWLEKELTTVTEQRDRLAEALERIRNYQGRFAEEDPESIAAEALQSLNQNA